ncbi:MAG: helix-turn-helix domain-containing protein [Pseudomonadota bacterium]
MAPEAEKPTASLHRSRSAERVLALLDEVATNGPLSMTAAATATALPASTALRHLHVLSDRGYVVRDDRGDYTVGPSLVRVALAALGAGPYARLTEAAHPHLEHLVEITEESAYVAVRDGTEAVYISTVESPRAIRHVGWVGRSVPVEGTAVGAALTADPETAGIFVNEGAVEADVAAVAAPVCGPSRVVGAISLLGPVERLGGRRRTAAESAVAAAAAATGAALAGL